MKKKFIINISALALLLLFGIIWSCKKEQKLGNAIYVTGTETSNTTNLVVTQTNNPNATIAVSATSSSILTEDATVTFAATPELVDVYNKTSPVIVYKPLPEGSYALSTKKALIKAGSNVSEGIRINVIAQTTSLIQGPYLLPITITSSVGGDGLPVLQSSKTIYIIVTVLNAADKAISLTNNFLSVNFASNNGNLQAMKAISYECRIKMNSFQAASPFISSVMGVEGAFLIRFGDIGLANNRIEVCTGGGNCIGNTVFVTGQWYHVAVTYDGTTISLYINGALDNTFKYSGTVNLTNGFAIGYSAGGRLADGAINEVRVWSKALTLSDIQNNMCSMDPSTPNFEAYWRLNEGYGSVCTDLTGHGHTATANISPVWINGLVCQ